MCYAKLCQACSLSWRNTPALVINQNVYWSGECFLLAGCVCCGLQAVTDDVSDLITFVFLWSSTLSSPLGPDYSIFTSGLLLTPVILSAPPTTSRTSCWPGRWRWGSSSGGVLLSWSQQFLQLSGLIVMVGCFTNRIFIGVVLRS